MESVGRLAGGVAHDYNNMLGVILGHTELALMKLQSESPIYGDLQQIQKAAANDQPILPGSCWALPAVRPPDPKVLDLNHTITGMLNMLKRLIGENIHLAWRPGEDLSSVKIDPTQIDQVLAKPVHQFTGCHRSYRHHLPLPPKTPGLTMRGSPSMRSASPGVVYVRLTVSDNGCGIG